jgi:hypothetical protein
MIIFGGMELKKTIRSNRLARSLSFCRSCETPNLVNGFASQLWSYELARCDEGVIALQESA